MPHTSELLSTKSRCILFLSAFLNLDSPHSRLFLYYHFNLLLTCHIKWRKEKSIGIGSCEVNGLPFKLSMYALVVDQLVQPLIPTPEDWQFESSHGEVLFIISCIKSVLKDENKEKSYGELAI